MPEQQRALRSQPSELQQLIAAASTLLVSSLDCDVTLQQIARPVAPEFADQCAIEVIADGGGTELRVEAPENADSFLLTEPGAIPPTVRILASPLIARGRTVGDIRFAWQEPDRPTHQDLEIAEELARIVALGVDNARLYHAARRELAERAEAEQQLLRKSRELRLLYEAGKLLSRTLDLDEIYDSLRALVAETMDCYSLLVSAVDWEAEQISCRYAWIDGQTLDVSVFPPVPLAPIGQGMQSTVIRTCQPLLVPDADAGMRLNKVTYHVTRSGEVRDAPAEGPRTRSIIMVPVRLDGRVYGVAQLSSARLNAYTDEHVRILEGLMSQVCVAAQNAVLYQRAQRDLEERNRADAEIQALNARLQRAMSETHHRVKNNLQVIAALAELSMGDSGEPIPSSAMVRIRDHTTALALLHDMLTQEIRKGQQIEQLPVRTLLERLLPLVRMAMGDRPLTSRYSDFNLSVHQAASLALVINECLTNAAKHGDGPADLALETEAGMARLVIRDSGPGFPDGFDAETAGHTGMELIRNLARWDLGGTVAFGNADQGGAQVTLVFPIAATPTPAGPLPE